MSEACQDDSSGNHAADAASCYWLEHHALDIIGKITRGQLSAAQVMQRCLNDIKRHDPTLAAFTCISDLSSAVQAAIGAVGPLGGLPVAVKDIFDSSDLPTSYGSPLYRLKATPRSNAAIINVMQRAGGVLVGKTTTTEFAFRHPTATLNPNALGRTPGGSSAGSAASVAAGLVPWAIGSQTAGSIIRPAAYCSVVGFKPSFGLLPTAGLKTFSWSLDTVGLFAKTVSEAAWLAQALSGLPLALRQPADLQGLKLRVPRYYPWGEASVSAGLAMTRALHAAEKAGITVIEVDMPSSAKELFEAHDVIQGWEASRSLAQESQVSPPAISDVLFEYLENARLIDDASYAQAQRVCNHARISFSHWLAPNELLLTPSTPDEAPAGLEDTGPATFNRSWSLLGGPCITVPSGKGINGFPVGVQLIGSHGQDSWVLKAAARLSANLDP